jgi:hypothetical protein
VTWFELQFRRDIPAPDSEQEGWVLEHERLYGVGRYDERVELLQTALRTAVLDGARIGPILAILRRAKHAQLLHSSAGARLDATRPHANRVAQIQRHLDAAAELLMELHRAVNPGDLPATATLWRGTELRIRDAVRDHPTLKYYQQRPFRRARAGAPSRPWVKTARRQLARVGVWPDLRENLLEAVGLVRYSPSRA